MDLTELVYEGVVCNLLQSYWAYFGLYPSSCMWKTKNNTTFRRLDLSPSSGGWGRINLLSWARYKELVSIPGYFLSSTYKTMDKVQNKPNSSVQLHHRQNPFKSISVIFCWKTGSNVHTVMNLRFRRRQGNFSVSKQQEDSQEEHGRIWKLEY
jgi:hypothetical protein